MTPTPIVVPADTPSIGQAHMEADGTIILDIRDTDGQGHAIDKRIAYSRNNPHYAELLRRLGGLSPGQFKPVPPFQPWTDPAGP